MSYYCIGFSTEQSNVLPGAKAGVALAVGELVYLDSSGYWQKAASITIAGTRTDAVGVITRDCLAYEFVSPVKSAQFSGYSGTVGAYFYLSTVAGAITETAPTATYRQMVGFMQTADVAVFNVQAACGSITTGGSWSITSLTTTGQITVATSGAPMAITASTYGFTVFTTTSVTTGDVTSSMITHSFTGAGACGWALKVVANVTDVALGAYANAGYFYLDLKTSGSISGLGTALCAELVMMGSAMPGAGTYGGIEIEIGCPTSWTGTNDVSFLYCNAYGATVGNFDDYGFFATLAGLTTGAAHLWYDHQGTAPSNVQEWVRWKTPAGTRYMPLYDAVV
jgi:hypothetical protein